MCTFEAGKDLKLDVRVKEPKEPYETKTLVVSLVDADGDNATVGQTKECIFQELGVQGPERYVMVIVEEDTRRRPKDEEDIINYRDFLESCDWIEFEETLCQLR
ncbi:uncharacterized protein LOC131948949 [Physella acuta]|uniref:uncharacterized protein LOC131948949 n=1 Tax=Physella acuta TaxID=109671 RepID=UPI0027DE37CC|nr:uncharacterized protein LOC131948949 [Physella acuta]